MAGSRGRRTHLAPVRLGLYSPAAQEVILELGSRASVALWFRGDCLFERDAGDWEDPTQGEVPLSLPAGESSLLFLVGRSHWGWGLRVAVDGSLPIEVRS